MFNERVWKDGERLAVEYMKDRGYKIIYRNYFCKIAEVDIVAILSKKVQKQQIKSEIYNQIKEISDETKIKMLKVLRKNQLKNLNDILIITEVKARTNEKFGKGFDAVSKNKIIHMKRAAEMLLKEKQFKNMQVRFDVASVDNGIVTYIENAF